ncbi:MAG TPA: bifunctional phosphopantothenoylcysteine decarboxylase/phosphopantothenate--cysteine ligase CoaBC [Caulobacteraceae bacterium]|nr:bifunctional phosphopantothenoylcysteine decarboxylase/phosphopantothenate--cysteine ligase CoaBC [Caulobacteraceae bacterium]
MAQNPTTKRVLLIVGGGIAAYKALALVRLLKKAGIGVRAVLTRAGEAFVTPLSLGALTEDKVYQDLFSLTDEHEMGHIELSREADLLVVAPATANLMAKMAHGVADDLASTVLLATDKSVLIAPAMNVRMWLHPATRRNLDQLKADGVDIVGPDEGEMACGEFGPGRMAEPEAIFAAIHAKLSTAKSKPLAAAQPTPAPVVARLGPLKGRRMLVTAGPTFEPIDPVRGLTNRSSGKQGYAVAQALAALGAEVTLVSGPTALDAPDGVKRVEVETAVEMEAACRKALPVEAAVCVAAVADWRPETLARQKVKKSGGSATVKLIENPDILAGLSKPGLKRPKIVIGFAAETEKVETNARAKLKAKGCDLMVANDVSSGVFGADTNTVTLVAARGTERWDKVSKAEVAKRLAEKIVEALK